MLVCVSDGSSKEEKMVKCIKAGENNNELKEAMDKGYEYYRSIGTEKMECKEVQITSLDDKHAVAHTKWNSVYLKGEEEASIPFKNNFLYPI